MQTSEKESKKKTKEALKNKQNAYFASQIVDSVHLYVSFSVGITLPSFDLVPDTMHHLDMLTKDCCLVSCDDFQQASLNQKSLFVLCANVMSVVCTIDAECTVREKP